ncbi:hypothetical protein HPB51_028799 [Rhipicephalus microplus]|uniref:HTH CENPB-type domain-containing protein n=1 Tax=Rhipicephalus microplus TaxID=6941 RepID=A0A9J6CWV1_RHIMP|nr:hypothetical protein HPB51_028799 [Rhipicephalus microplus]
MATNNMRRAFHGPKSGKFPDIEKAVLEYVKDMRKGGCAVSLDMIRTQARTVSRRLATKDFCACSGWTTRFMEWTVAEAAEVVVPATCIRIRRQGDRFP